MIHIDLFSGIGGFSLAVDWVWNNAGHIFCDNNKFCQQVIKKNFGEVLIYDDIREVTGERIIADAIANGYTERYKETGRKIGESKQRWMFKSERENSTAAHSDRFGSQKQGTRKQTSEDRQLPKTVTNSSCGEPWEPTEPKRRENIGGGGFQVDLLTGGFPCQPFSQAGKRKGKGDDRFLWPEMLRIIKELKPSWIIGENVAGIISMAQRQGDAEVEDQTGNENNIDEGGNADGIICEILNQIEQVGYDVQTLVIPACAVNAPHRRDRVWIVANTRHRDGQRIKKREKFEGQISGAENAVKSERPNCVAGKRDAPDTSNQGLERSGDKGKGLFRHQDRTQCNERREWDKNWIEVATQFCRVDDGIPVELDEFKLTKAGHRVERLKALGNAIVPALVVEIMKAIKQIEED